ncbi:sensor histidine kinase [Brevibacillus sp. GCM10020057]|uniref:sensor histidine kinase n=1 Tax=Brevibacillus sp. GCM10020057 TaxID=3317327 RepID=UPI0036333BA0
MFEQTRKKLTLMYSGMLAFILIAVFVGFYWTLAAVISRNEQAQLESIGEKAVHEWREFQERRLSGRPLVGESPARDRIDVDFLQENQMMLLASGDEWLIKTSGKHGDAVSAAIAQEVLRQSPEPGRISHVQLSVEGEEKTFAVYRPLVGSGDADGESDIRLYLGEDVSRMEQLLDQMKWALLVIGIVLLGVAALIGYWFSGRAMVPINLSYKRQKDFATDASHELRTPLSVILSSAEILQDQKESLPAFHQSVLQGMLDEIHRMNRLVNDLLTLARSDVETNPKWSFQPFDLLELVGEVVNRMQIKADRKKVTIVNRADRGTAAFWGHADSIRQLFYILLDNAVKYSEPGEKVEMNVVKEGTGRIVCSVHNNGNGIPEADLPYVFERFYRADKARSRDVEGTGLGLAIAAQIVRMHKGQISVSSSREEGTLFTVVFPSNQRRGDKSS